MKLKPYNKFTQLLVEDPIKELTYFSYEAEVNLPRIIVSEKPEVSIQSFGDHVNIVPFEMESEEQFNKLAIEAILMAHKKVSKNTANTFEEAQQKYKEWDVGDVHAILMSPDERTHTIHMVSEKCVKNGVHLFMFQEVDRGYAYILPVPEFIGVISERLFDNGDEWHGIGIINPFPIIKTYIG